MKAVPKNENVEVVEKIVVDYSRINSLDEVAESLAFNIKKEDP